MSRTRDITTSFALGASLFAHAFIIYAVAEYYTRANGWRISFAPPPKPEAPVAWLVREPQQQFEQKRPDNEIGESTGTGDSSHQADGAQSLQAPEAPDAQAFLSRDPSGPGAVGTPPSPSLIPPSPGHPADSQPFGVPSKSDNEMPSPKNPPKPPAPVVPPPPPPPPAPQAPDSALIGIPITEEKKPDAKPPEEKPPETKTPPDKIIAKADDATPTQPSPDEKKPEEKPSDAKPTDEKKSAEHKNQPAVPASPDAADPAPQSDSESDPFSKVGSVEFQQGSSKVRFGRKVKTTRPRLSLAAQYDLASAVASPRVILKIKTDETGNVIDVSIVKSSGSNEIDGPCQRAVYEWWFEPLKDAAGKPQPDVILFAIDFRRV